MFGKIYLITNNINNKKYVGKTLVSLKERFETHKRDSRKEDIKGRPLYSAFNKYGFENFSITLIEECSIDNLDEREIFWIKEYNTYNNGYNATLGGDGKILYDYDEIISLTLENIPTKQICEIVGCCHETVVNALLANGITPFEYSIKIRSKEIYQYDKQGNFIQSFQRMSEAIDWLINNQEIKAERKSVNGNIYRVANGERKSAYGYIWKYQ